MSLETAEIYWDAFAHLNVLEPFEGRPIEYRRGGKVATGSLARCIHLYMQMPDERKPGSNITFDRRAIAGQNGMLQEGEIEIVAARSDFPKR